MQPTNATNPHEHQIQEMPHQAQLLCTDVGVVKREEQGIDAPQSPADTVKVQGLAGTKVAVLLVVRVNALSAPGAVGG